jgi:hypothetical protein
MACSTLSWQPSQGRPPSPWSMLFLHKVPDRIIRGAMNGKCLSLVLVGSFLIAAGCEKKTATQPRAMSALMLTNGYSSAEFAMSAYASTTLRFIAESHKLEVITTESELQKSWESAVAFCGTIQCEVVSSSITARTADSIPSGSISLRVVPEDLKKLLSHVEKLGKVAQHTTQREDKTIEVVDTEAKIKNLTSFRDNLRAMLGKPSATVKDLVEIQKQLTDTQSELDSETTQRKILANETEKIAVEISFRVERPGGRVGGLAQIWNTLRESGSVLADSTSSMIYTIVAVVPWLVLILPAIWLLLKVWRKVKLRRTRSAAGPPSRSAS